MKNLLPFIVLFFVFTTRANAHETHITLTNIDFDKNNVLVAVRIDANDFAEMEYYKKQQESDDHHHHHHHHYSEKVTQLNDEQISRLTKYVKNNIKIYSNNNSIDLNLNKCEYKNGFYWVSLKTETPNVKEITIKNTLFIEAFSYQQNLVTVNYFGNEQGIDFNTKLTEKTINLQKAELNSEQK